LKAKKTKKKTKTTDEDEGENGRKRRRRRRRRGEEDGTKRRALLAVAKRFERGRDMRRGEFGIRKCRVDHVGGGGGRRERGVDESVQNMHVQRDEIDAVCTSGVQV
jgi:hypothetical protein